MGASCKVWSKKYPKQLNMVDLLNMCYWRGGTYWRRDGRLNTISLALEVLIKSLLQSAHLFMCMCPVLLVKISEIQGEGVQKYCSI